MRIVSVGEILWDVIGPSEYLGGAPLNFAAHARKLRHEVYLVSALGDDERGRRAMEGLQRCGVSADFVQVIPGKRTGTAEVELDAEGKPIFQIIRPAAYDFLNLKPADIKKLADLHPEWIYFGTLFHNSHHALDATLRLLKQVPDARRFFDVNLRDGNWNLAAVEQLASLANVVKLSDSEAESLDASVASEGLETSLEHFCKRWSGQYGCQTICVTLGERGCAIYKDGQYTEVPGRKINVEDTVGAGDAFAAAFLHGTELNWSAQRCGVFANAAAALVASRPGATPEWHVDEVWTLLKELPAKI